MFLVPDSVHSDVSRCTARVAGIDAVPDALLLEWRALAEQASEPNAFAEGWFLAPAFAALRNGRSIRLIEVRDARGNLAGVMPVTLYSHYGRMPVRHVSNWTHFQCFMGSPLVRRGDEGAFWLAVLALLDTSDWACGLLSVSALLEGGPIHQGLKAAAAGLGRPCPTVHRYERAALASDMEPEAYLAAMVRPKKRKELRRLANRLSDMGVVSFSTLERGDQIEGWCNEFLALEAAGWKGKDGAAFANLEETTAFFRAVVTGAFEAGRLDFQRLDLDGRAIAMLVNFRTPPGSWSFKIAYDEELARFSPGVLIELQNLPRVLNDPEIEWMDSCAIQDHPMINSLWGQRRAIVQVSVPLSGVGRRAIFRACRAAETASATLRRLLKRV
jgi:CelD/BcsL family acetyltransferase involved in cellulose biosynthesis